MLGSSAESLFGTAIGAPTIDLFDEYRDKRHKTLYSGDYYPDAGQARRIVAFADGFLQKIAALMKR